MKTDPGDLQIVRDRALAGRIRRGEEQAVREFCATYLPRLYQFALQRLASPEDADDVVQIVLSTAARRIETFRGDATLYSWLLAICRREAGRCAATVARRRSMIVAYGDGSVLERMEAPDGEAPEHIWNERRRAEAIRACLGRLPERYAEVLEMKYMCGYSTKEIAAGLAMSDQGVQSLLARARRTFREVCDDELRKEIEWTNGG